MGGARGQRTGRAFEVRAKRAKTTGGARLRVACEIHQGVAQNVPKVIGGFRQGYIRIASIRIASLGLPLPGVSSPFAWFLIQVVGVYVSLGRNNLCSVSKSKGALH